MELIAYQDFKKHFQSRAASFATICKCPCCNLQQCSARLYFKDAKETSPPRVLCHRVSYELICKETHKSSLVLDHCKLALLHRPTQTLRYKRKAWSVLLNFHTL